MWIVCQVLFPQKKKKINKNNNNIKIRVPAIILFYVEVLQPSQPNGVMLSVVSLPNHTFTGQA